ncbi:MAG: hypothetical protein IJL06_03800 [Kiritimatiellae bacterium]|nr:hypothetical protein [Kiritimatiellia bacterium]
MENVSRSASAVPAAPPAAAIRVGRASDPDAGRPAGPFEHSAGPAR